MLKIYKKNSIQEDIITMGEGTSIGLGELLLFINKSGRPFN
jgi:hypothetical protein